MEGEACSISYQCSHGHHSLGPTQMGKAAGRPWLPEGMLKPDPLLPLPPLHCHCSTGRYSVLPPYTDQGEHIITTTIYITRKCYSVGQSNASATYIGDSTSLCQFIEPDTYSILCPMEPRALSSSKKLKRITVLIQKEPVSCTS